MEHVFFKPWIGENFNDGLQGVKTLVIGASFYCNNSECPFRKECIINSRPFKNTCPDNKSGKDLSYSCEIEIESFLERDDYYTTYENFTSLVLESFPNITKEELWNHIAFYEYVQHFLGSWTTPQYRANKLMFDKDFPALEEVISDIEPELIIIWGAPVRNAIINNWPNEIIRLEEEDYNHWTTYKEKPIMLYYMHHPSAPQLKPTAIWSDHIKFLRKAIDLIKEKRGK